MQRSNAKIRSTRMKQDNESDRPARQIRTDVVRARNRNLL